jgi:hypothetical protein
MVNENLTGSGRGSTVDRIAKSFTKALRHLARRPVAALFAGAAPLVLAACAWTGPADDLLTQRLTWFDFAGAGDVRRACAAGGRDHTRVIVVADYDRQVRNYDLAVGPSGQGRLVQIVDRGLAIDPTTTDLLDVFRPTVVERRVAAAEIAALDRALAADALVPDGPRWTPPVGRQLQARQHFLLVAACRDGRFTLAGRADPTVGIDAFETTEVLRRLDTTGIAWPSRPPALDAASPGACESLQRRGERQVCFTLQIGEDGLVGR